MHNHDLKCSVFLTH